DRARVTWKGPPAARLSYAWVRARLLGEAVRRGGRVAEGARLESVFTGNRNVGSNPTPSAIFSFSGVRHHPASRDFPRKSALLCLYTFTAIRHYPVIVL